MTVLKSQSMVTFAPGLSENYDQNYGALEPGSGDDALWYTMDFIQGSRRMVNSHRVVSALGKFVQEEGKN